MTKGALQVSMKGLFVYSGLSGHAMTQGHRQQKNSLLWLCDSAPERLALLRGKHMQQPVPMCRAFTVSPTSLRYNMSTVFALTTSGKHQQVWFFVGPWPRGQKRWECRCSQDSSMDGCCVDAESKELASEYLACKAQPSTRRTIGVPFYRLLHLHLYA